MRKLMAILASAVLFCTQLYAQNRTVNGKVTDDKGGQLVGVTVSTSSSNRRVLTDNGGNFSIQVSPNDKSLRFSYVGFVDQSVTLGASATYGVSLVSENTALSEVVVVGYGTQRKKELTGSIASVKGEVLAGKPTQSFEQALGGRAAGVQITIPSGVLNSPPVIRVRGTNSISLSSYPLIVIDGIPMFTGDFSSTNSAGNALASLNPNDIESVDVAKDAAATAIYGSRAANGVLFVTTKKGKAGRSKVTLDSWLGWSQVQRLPELLDAFQYTDLKNAALTNAGTFSATNQFALMNGPDGKPINTRWYDYVYRTGIMHSNSVSVSGANEATSYYFSAGYTKQQGIIKRNDFNRLSLLMNIDHKATKHVSLGGKIQYSKEDNLAAVSSGSLGDAFSTAGLGRVVLVTAPNISPYNNDGSYSYSGALIGVGGNKLGQVGFNNPVIQLDQNRTNSFTDHIIGNLYLQVKPFSWLTLRSTYGMDYILVDNDQYFSPISGEGFSSNGSTTTNFTKNLRTVWTNTMQFDKTFAGKHTVSLLGGIEEQNSTGSGYGLNRINVSDPAFTNIQGGWATPNAAGLSIGQNYLYSQFGRLQYSFDKRYTINGSLRRDGASQLGINSKYGVFWAASAAWEIANEKFWSAAKLDRVFSSFRIRGSYGKVGNIGGLGNFASLSTFGAGLYGGSGTLSFNSAGNNNLTWETSKKTDIGINFGILNDRITGELTYYNSNTDGLLLFVPQPPSAGLPSTIPANVGTMYNRGIEFALNASPITGKEFSWNTSFNISYNKNQVTSLALGLDQIVSATGGLENPSITKAGYPIGMIFVTRTKGVDPATGRRIFVNAAGKDVYFQHVAPAGQSRFMYADGTTAPSVSSADAMVYKNTNPKLYGGFDNTFRFRGFELNALFTYQFGSYLYYGTNAGLRDQRFWNNSTDMLRRWQKAGDQTEIPKVIFGDNVSNGSSFPLDVNVFSGDFVKLRSLTLGYNLPKSMLEKVKISNARFYVSGNNLLIMTKYPGPDPEVSSNGNGSSNFGIDRNTVANQRTITIGLNVGF
ncbi:SusC/RagA family TonB-linked outer membrane protein [Sediminibacterium soli]|uniref:SusC/RagA family TonB-linked outer membrane protein n=1 Tax=Sediminibacterium soli TaxID=2698829 RepID=UPI001379D60A|nr:TonB-dependent receptor [Sediminibacterium soli]NCI47600.1 TonB-dependent receptor [Sediminibacterium soli]